MSYTESLQSLQKHVVNGDTTKVEIELNYLNDLVKAHNVNSATKWSMSELLSTRFRTSLESAITPLEYAVIYAKTSTAASLRKYGAPETSLTAWAPGFWNAFNFTSVAATKAEAAPTAML